MFAAVVFLQGGTYYPEHACTRTVVGTYNNNSLHHGLAFFSLFWAICIRRSANGATQRGLGLG